jgi:hypothetical protein
MMAGLFFQDIEFPSDYYIQGGSKIADSLIMMEIAKNIQTASSHSYIFLTNDLTNAMATSAENINSLYIQSVGSLINDPYKQFNNLLYQCAIYFDECFFYKIKSDGSKKGKRIEGMWSGKNTSEWSNKILRYSNI